MTTLSALAALLFAAAATLAAQSLGDIARQEEDRRKSITAPGKVYTNDSLRPEPPPSTPPATAAPAQPAAPAPAAPDAAAPAAGGAQPPQTPGQPPAGQLAAPPAPQTEADWRKRITAARDALARSQTFADALQSRINALSTDFVNRDDPVQRDLIAADRQKSLVELDRVRREMPDQQKAIAAIQEEARRAGVPAGWVR